MTLLFSTLMIVLIPRKNRKKRMKNVDELPKIRPRASVILRTMTILIAVSRFIKDKKRGTTKIQKTILKVKMKANPLQKRKADLRGPKMKKTSRLAKKSQDTK